MDENGEITVIVAHARDVVPELDTGNITQSLAVTDGNLVAGLDGLVDLTEVEESVGGAYLVHLGVDAGSNDLGLSGKAEVLEVIDASFGLLVMHHHGTTFDSVVDFGGMETQSGHVTSVEQGNSVLFHSKGVGGIVDDAETVFVGDVLDGLGVARLAIDMYGHDGGGTWGDGCFNLIGVKTAGGPVDVDEDGLDAVPPQRMGGRDETIGGCDDLAADMERLESGDERQRAVGEKTHVGYLKVLGKGLFQLFMERTVIGNPFRCPDVFQH